MLGEQRGVLESGLDCSIQGEERQGRGERPHWPNPEELCKPSEDFAIASERPE